MKTQNAEKKRKSGWKSVLFFALLLGGVYLVNVQVQTYLGERALEKLDLELLTIEEAMAKSAETGRPILAEMSAIWCTSCRRFDSRVLSDPAVSAMIKERFVYARVDYDDTDGKRFMQRYGITGIPHALVLDSEGVVIRELILSYDPAHFGAQLERVLGEASTSDEVG